MTKQDVLDKVEVVVTNESILIWAVEFFDSDTAYFLNFKDAEGFAEKAGGKMRAELVHAMGIE